MGPRMRRKVIVLMGSVIFTVFSFQLTGFIALGGDEDSQRFNNNALPSTKGNFKTFSPVKGRGSARKSVRAGRHLKEEVRIDSRDTRRILQDVRTADDIKGHPRIGESAITLQGADSLRNVTVAMTTRLQFESLFPSLLEEERCPLCYGTTNCDQIYAGNISFLIGSVNLSEPHVISGYWGGRRILGKRLVRREMFQRLEKIICDESRVDPGRSCEINAAATNSWMSQINALNRVHKLHKDVYKDDLISLR